MTILEICAYAAPYEGNFIQSLKALVQSMPDVRFAFAFPESARDIPWVRELNQSFDVFSLPLTKARIRPSTYISLKKFYGRYSDLGIIHTHFELYDVPALLSAPRGTMVFWHLHDAIEEYRDFRNRLIHKAQYGFLHGRSRLISVSQKHMAYAVRLGFPSEHTLYVPNGLDTARIQSVATAYAARPYDFLIFGWEYKRKGVDLCVEAWKKTGLKMRIGVVTADGGELPPSFERIKPQADVNALYAKTKCFLHISRAEGHSYALLEAIYAGLPVICSDIPENRFAAVFPTVTMVRSEDTNAIAQAMTAALQKGDCGAENKALARARIEQEYSVSAWARSIRQIYEAQMGKTKSKYLHF